MVGLDLGPAFDKAVKDNPNCDPPRDGHCHGDDEEPADGSLSYEVTNFGAITTSPTLIIDGRRGVGKNSKSIRMGAPLTAEKMVLTDAFADALGDTDDLGKCFPRTSANPATAPLGGFGSINDAFTATLQPDKKNPTKIHAQYFFKALGTDGVTKVDYNLVLTGMADASFPPAPGMTTTVTWDTAEMTASGSGKLGCLGPVEVTGADKVEILGDEIL